VSITPSGAGGAYRRIWRDHELCLACCYVPPRSTIGQQVTNLRAVARCEARCVGVACAVGVELITDAGATAST